MAWHWRTLDERTGTTSFVDRCRVWAGGPLRIVVVLGLLVLTGCDQEATQSMLDPAGPGAAEVLDLWWLMFFMGLLVYVGVMGFVLFPLFQQWWVDEPGPKDAEPPLGHTPFVLLGGAILPALILTLLLVFALETQVSMSQPEADLTVEVVGHQWWWEVHYPEQDITTANEIYIPAGERVRLELTAEDVIHSFWVPRLGGKRDLLPEQETTFWMEADTADVYRGQCAEYCGLQHTNMVFQVIALPPDEFENWVADKQAPPPTLEEELAQRGREVFMESNCVDCHRIEGTEATGEMGPDLTHIASRRTLGAGMIENNRGNLYGWIVNPQKIKPGNRMPPTYLEPEELHALVEYLERLE